MPSLNDILCLDKTQASIKKIDLFLSSHDKNTYEYIKAVSFKATILDSLGKTNDALKLVYSFVPEFRYLEPKSIVEICNVIIDISITNDKYDQAIKYITVKKNYLAVSESSEYYKDQICALTTYNWDALGNPDPYYYGDPWQLIYVFDGNSNTNVVCEGYSKAFAYLCEKTNFADSSVNCYIVTGTMDGGPHMWNILRWSDGKNYLVDVTNCDDLGNDLFMAVPKSGSVSAGYTYKLLNNNIKFVYDDDTKAQYSTEDLTIGSKLTSALKDISLEYSAFIKSKTAVPFTIVREGGTNATQFRLDSVVYVENNTTIFTGSYGNDNVINVTFP